jgi:tetratricopeptide (TPR) repeat protein
MMRARTMLAGAGLIVIAAVAAYYGLRDARPAMPEVDLQDEAPAVVAAVTGAQQEVCRSPRSGPAWGELGLVFLGNDLSAPAHVCFVNAERFEPTNAAWPYLQALRLLVDDREAALRALERAVALTTPLRPDTVAPRLVLAEALFAKDERTEARELLQQVVAIEPANARAEYNLGLIALAEARWEGGILHLARCGGNAYAGKRACAQLATAYQRLGNRVAAANFSRRAHELPEDRPWPDPYLERARDHAAGPHRHLQHAQLLVGTTRTAEYLQALRDGADEAPDGVGHYRLGMALVMMGDHAAGEPVLRTAVRKSPELVGGHYFLGIALYQQGEQIADQARDQAAAEAKFQDAAAELRRAIALKPTHGPAHQMLGRCLKRCGHAADALAEFRLAVQCQPENAEAQLALGEALAATGAYAEAEHHLKQAQRLAPADPRPPAALARVREAAKTKMVPSSP